MATHFAAILPGTARLAHPLLSWTGVKTLQVPFETREIETSGFWHCLLRDKSVTALSPLEQLLTGCEIIAALDDLELLEG